MPFSRRIVMAVAAASALNAAGCSRSAREAAEATAAIPVTAEAVRLGDIHGVVSATGVVTTLPGAEVALVAPYPGRIADITKKAGDAVKAGELLIRFEFSSLAAEPAVRAAALRAANLRLSTARLLQTRVQGLVDRGAASRLEAAAADREVAAAETELAEAQAIQQAADSRGQNTSMLAPFNGVVTERLHNPGDAVGSVEGDAILRIIDPRQVQVTATVSLADMARIAIGASARAMAEGRQAPEPLRVASRPAPDANATTVPVTLAFDVPTELAPGTQVGIEIDAEQHSNVALVPAIAVVRNAAGEAAVFIASGNAAHRRPVVTGLMDTERVEIQSGVKVGELIITQGLSDLRDGMAVTVGSP